MPPPSKRQGLSLKTSKSDNCVARNKKSMQQRQCHRPPPTKRITLLSQPPRAPRSLQPPPSSLTSDNQDSAPASLHSNLILLQQLYVRHKNQHRSQTWFKSLGLLCRSLRKLYDVKLDLLSLQQPLATEAPNSTKSADQVRRSFDLESHLRTQAEGILVGIRETVLPRCYVAFSTVVADAQFAPLGVVLIGVVADVSKVVGMPTPRYGLQEEERVERSGNGLGGGEVAGRIRRETGRGRAAEMDVRFELGVSEGGTEDVDLGEIVVRDGDDVVDVADVADNRLVEHNEESDVDVDMAKREGSRFTQRPLASSPQTPARTKRQGQAGKSIKKKSKKKSAIDDIFADFG